MSERIGNQLRLLLFCALIGAFSGAVFWIFLFLVDRGTWLIWELAPTSVTSSLWYSVLVGGLGGLAVGLLRARFGKYPEGMETVLSTLKSTGTYAYTKLPAILACAILSLIVGSSVGPEAGMVSVIVCLCCWAGENLRFASAESAYLSKVGASASLSILFRSPLFGFFDVEEDVDGEGRELTKSGKILSYCVAAGAGFGLFALLNSVFGNVTTSFPSFEPASATWLDLALFLPFVLLGIALALVFTVSEQGFELVAERLPPVVGELACGIVLGLICALWPGVRFSGEEQMGEMIAASFVAYAPLMLIGVAFLKVLLTNLCISWGLAGGHFFPLIYAAVCLGAGCSLFISAGDLGHATIAAGVVAAACLGTTMRKPLAVAMLLLLCFPVRMLVWTVPAAALAAWVVGLVSGKRSKAGKAGENSGEPKRTPERPEPRVWMPRRPAPRDNASS